MKLENLHSVYFLGIGGIGMSALARWFHAKGFTVTGYDKTPTELTHALVSEGIAIHFDDDINQIPSKVKEDKDGSLVVFTPAVPKDLKEYNYFLGHGFVVYKRSQVLGMLTKAKFTIAVAGTHGKTTTSSMVAHLLKSAGVDCSAFIGGIMTNYNTNMIIGENDQIMVVEADEFDRSFLTLHPDIAIITATDADHLDIYGSRDELKKSFKDFIKNIKTGGTLFVEESIADDLDVDTLKDIKVVTYGLKTGDVSADNSIKIENGFFNFNFRINTETTDNFSLAVPGFHNVSNALAALAATYELVEDKSKLVAGIKSYRGVKRRFEYIIKSDNLIYIDDYAHHPEEINALLSSVRALYPKSEITAIFQPHLFSRTRDFVDGFAASLSAADKVLLLDIYPAREKPIEGVTSDIVKSKIEGAEVISFHKDDVLGYFDTNTPQVLLTVGAGDIDTLIAPIKNKLLAI